MNLQMLDGLLASHNPALPDAVPVRLYLSLAWAAVLAAVGMVALARITPTIRRAIVMGMAIWALLPGPFSPAYWLGLAFQAPSLTTVLLCGWWVWRAGAAGADRAQPAAMAVGWVWLVPAVVVGYLLLLDTLALWPVQMYRWGFSTALLLGLMAWAMAPWLLRSAPVVPVWIVPVALLVFVGSRLPTGNVWDALLDPLLWLGLQAVGVRALFRRLRRSQAV